MNKISICLTDKSTSTNIFVTVKRKDDSMQLSINRCGISQVMLRLGGKWKLLILWRIHQQEGIRFNELKRQTNGITNVMLTRCLNDLIADGFVTRTDFQTIPPHVEYSLTELGKSFLPIMETMDSWGKEHLGS